MSMSMSIIPEHILATERKCNAEKEKQQRIDDEYNVLRARITKQFQKQFEEKLTEYILSHKSDETVTFRNRNIVQFGVSETVVSKLCGSYSLYKIGFRTVTNPNMCYITVKDKTSVTKNKTRTGKRNEYTHNSDVSLSMENLINFMIDRKIKFTISSENTNQN